jgi:zeaxanthin glucosyltransferase
VQEIRSALSMVLGDPSYRNAAKRIQAEIRSVHGLERATDLIEQSLRSHAGDFGRSSEA